MLDIPDLRGIIEQAVQNGWSTQEIQGAMMQTDWWRTRTESQRQYIELKANNPAELDASNPGSKANQMMNHIWTLAGQAGISLNLSVQQLQFFTLAALNNGWDDAQIKGEFANLVQTQNANAGSIGNQMEAISNSYLVAPSLQDTNWWASQIAAGFQTLDTYKAHMQEAAISRYPWLTTQLQQGQTMATITDPMRQDIASLLEISPTQVDFTGNKFYAHVLDYVPPGETDHRMMTRSEADTYIRGLPQYGTTQQARDSVGQQVSSLLKTWGTIS